MKKYRVTLKSISTGETSSVDIQVGSIIDATSEKQLKVVLQGLYGEEYQVENLEELKSVVSIRIIDYCPN